MVRIFNGTKLLYDVVKVVPTSGVPLQVSGINPGFLIPAYDYIALTYSGTNLTNTAYKLGGSGGTTVATLALSYDASGNVTTVTKT